MAGVAAEAAMAHPRMIAMAGISLFMREILLKTGDALPNPEISYRQLTANP
jgi:hypothetical protein